MPVIILEGGLGNQLFQLANAHSILSEDVLNFRVLFNHGSEQKREFDSQFLIENCKHVHDYAITDSLPKYIPGGNWRSSSIKRHYVQVFNSLFGHMEIEEFAFNPLDIGKSLLKEPFVRGYFQHFKYVQRSSDTFLPEIWNTFAAFPWFKETASLCLDSVSLHIRRGDYNFDAQGLLGLDYYFDAIERNRDSKINVFSDSDSVLIKIKKHFPFVATFGPKEKDPWQVLASLATSAKVITANSTLSWWGGYLASSNNRPSDIPFPWFRSFNVKDAFNEPSMTLRDAIWE